MNADHHLPSLLEVFTCKLITSSTDEYVLGRLWAATSWSVVQKTAPGGDGAAGTHRSSRNNGQNVQNGIEERNKNRQIVAGFKNDGAL